jgi:hypothetical protein
MTNLTAKLDFDELYSLKQFVDQIRQKHVSALRVFGSEDTIGFKLSESAPPKSRISISSTATCIGSLLISGVWSVPTNSKGDLAWWVGKEAEYLKRLLKANWTSAGLPANNPFSVAFVLEAACLLKEFLKNGNQQVDLSEQVQFGDDEYRGGKKEEVGIERTTDYQTLLRKCADILNQALLLGESCTTKHEASISVLEYPPSAYLTQLAARALKAAGRLTEQDKVANWAAREIPAQCALIQAGSRNADPLQLLFLIICLASFRPAARETPNELDLIKYGIKVFFGQQKADGGWPLSRPLFHYPTSGSAYCYDYEALAQLFLCESLYDGLFEFLPQIKQATLALDSTKFKLGTGGYGWPSNHHPQSPGPESWSSASVYLFLFALDRFIAEGIRRTIARELEVPYTGVRRGRDDARQFATAFLDCPVSASEPGSLKEAIFKRLVKPIKDSAPLVAKGQKLPDDTPVSAILFGPPGTSKTEIVEQIADYIGWPSFSVDPSYFVRSGLDAIQAQANGIFRMLSSAEEIVVLFDEFDEMVRNRESTGEMLSRFLTTAMLPKLAKINKQRRILFIVATNYIDSFDVAISRAGRFDYVIQMMPPTATAKLEAPDDRATHGWARQLQWVKEHLHSAQFDSELADLTFLETRAFVARIERERGVDEEALISRLPQLWEAALKRCTLRRASEIGDVVLTGGTASTTELKYRRRTSSRVSTGDTWKERSMRQTAFIRLDDF